MTGTFSGHSTSTYTLTKNPTTITSTGLIDVNSTIAYTAGVLGISGIAWTLTNLGTIESVGTGGFGVDLASGGQITNGASGASGALIDGANRGVYIRGATGTVTNFGIVEGTGAGGEGIHLDTGGAVFNRTTGVITGIGGGAYSRGAPGTIVNAGIIRGTGTTFGDGGGVWLQDGGTVTNTGRITSIANYGVGLSNIGGSVINSGSIAGAVGVDMGDFKNTTGSVSLTNQVGGRISGYDGVVTTPSHSTVSNSGSISGTAAVTIMGYHLGDGVVLADGGALTNHPGGVISGAYCGVQSENRSATVANFGTIKGIGNGAFGVYLNAGGRVTNAGLIKGDDAVKSSVHGTVTATATVTNSGTIMGTGTHGSGIILDEGGSVGNTGLIEGRLGVSSNYGSAPGSITNYGTILGIAGVGIHLGGGGVLTNHAGGRISGWSGIFSQHIATTMINAGTITGTLIGTFHGYPFGDGAYLGAGGLLVNQTGGLVTGLRNAVSLGGTTSAAATLSNAGTITGSVGISISPTDTGNNTIVNSGRITGTGGTAVQFGAGNDKLIVKPGALFNGAVRGGGGVNTIIQGASGTLKVIGFSGFETIRLANGGADSLTLTGANFTGVGGHVITVDDGNSGNAVTASALPATDRIVVHAGTGADTLKGGAGSDIFYAGGKTKMTGSAGANQFTFAHIGTNVITDFGASASNKIVLRDSGFNLGADEGLGTGTPKHLATSVFVANLTGTFTTTAQRFTYNKTTRKLSYSAHGSGSAASSVVTLTSHPSLSAGATGNLFFTS